MMNYAKPKNEKRDALSKALLERQSLPKERTAQQSCKKDRSPTVASLLDGKLSLELFLYSKFNVY